MSAILSAASPDSQKAEYVTDLSNRIRKLRDTLNRLRAVILNTCDKIEEDTEALARVLKDLNEANGAQKSIYAELGHAQAFFVPKTTLGSNFGRAAGDFGGVMDLSQETGARYLLLVKRSTEAARTSLQSLLSFMIQPSTKRPTLAPEIDEACLIRSLRTRVAAEAAQAGKGTQPRTTGSLLAVGGP